MDLPTPRGPLGRALHDLLTGPPDGDPAGLDDALGAADPHDRALTLWVLHELHYRGFEDVDDRWEWAPALMPLRRALEDELEARLRARFAAADPAGGDLAGAAVAAAVPAIIRAHDGPSLARHVQRHATREQVVELFRQRSVYHLKEGDPTSWVIARLPARPKAALLEIQFDEYGAGDPDRLHHELFRVGLGEMGLDAGYGHYVDQASLPVLEHNNALSLFGLHRRLRGAALGHLAAFEATSSVPSSQLAQGLDRLGFPASIIAYYDEHVEADAVHEQVALVEVCGALVDDEPDQRDDVLLGAWSALDLEARTATHLLETWRRAAA